MAWWDSKAGKIRYWPPRDAGNGWIEMDCGCCRGIQWGGEYPRECRYCSGGGVYFLHLPSRVLARYPGGPLLGRTTKEHAREVHTQLKEPTHALV